MPSKRSIPCHSFLEGPVHSKNVLPSIILCRYFVGDCSFQKVKSDLLFIDHNARFHLVVRNPNRQRPSVTVIAQGGSLAGR